MKDTRKEDDYQKETSFTGRRAGDQHVPCIRISNERYAKDATFGDRLTLEDKQMLRELGITL